MDLPNLFSSSSKSQTEPQVLCVLLTDVNLQVLLLSLTSEGVKIEARSGKFSYEGLENCVLQTDKALQQLPDGSESVEEVVFALESTWVGSDDIKTEKKPFIKKLTEDLSLKPLGYVEISESLAQQKVSENSLYSGMAIYVSETDLHLTLVYQGKIITTEVVGRSSDFSADFLEGIARIHAQLKKHGNYIPQRTFLATFDLNEKQIREYQQAIYDQNWEERKEFLQPPTVNLLSEAQFLTSLANESGKSAALEKGLQSTAFAASVPQKRLQEDTVEQTATELGFADPNDAQKKQEVVETAEPDISNSDTKTEDLPTSFGVPIKNSTLDVKAIAEADNLKEADLRVPEQDDAVLKEQPLEKQGSRKDRKRIDWTHKKNTKWFIVLGVILGVVALILSLVLGAPYFVQTQLSVELQKKPVAEDITLTLDTKLEETDPQSLTIAADTVQKTKKSSSTMQTTGIKIVGENATGTVAVYNKTDAVKKFEKGTQLKYNDLIYTLDQDITVASASSKQGGEDYGREDVAVTAAQIGADSNIEKDSALTVASYDTDSYEAFVVDDDFTGGSSREVRVVAQEDRSELLQDLKTELIEAINKEFSDESGDGTYILPSKAVVDEVASFDAEVEDEAEDITLTLEITVEAVSYSGGDLKPVAQEILSQKVPENYQLVDAEPQILSSPSQTDLDNLESGAVVSIEANISSYALPLLSEEEIKQQVAGKQFSQAQTELTSREEIVAAEFKIIPQFLQPLVSSVSKRVENISIYFQE